jgi:hypothetical protein
MIGIVAIWALSAVAVGAAWWYFRACAITRPPLGTVNLGDITMTLGFVVVLPFLYLWLPGWLVVTMLAITALSVLSFVIEPLAASPVVRWGAVGGLVVAHLVAARAFGTGSGLFLLVNDAVMLGTVVGVSNLWAQGGLRARHLAIFAGAIAAYDLVATGMLPLTTDMLGRLAGFPFLPMVAWPTGGGEWAGIGLGDLLVAAVGPLVMRKAYGRGAGLATVALALGSIGGVLLVARWEALPETFPTMIVLGTLLAGQVWWLSRRHNGERTFARYLAEEPLADMPERGSPVPVAAGTRLRPGV